MSQYAHVPKSELDEAQIRELEEYEISQGPLSVLQQSVRNSSQALQHGLGERKGSVDNLVSVDVDGDTEGQREKAGEQRPFHLVFLGGRAVVKMSANGHLVVLRNAA
ncbi:hypothetical protein LQV05_004108 [Cryptococcus neoformans]|nr:hypothetical protein LQV05_004108 [Cryptococcus neoformans]